MAETDDIRRPLFSCYNASFGGKYELAGAIERLDELVQHGWVRVSECRKDPMSNHKAKTCRVLLLRMTEKGLFEAKKSIGDKAVVTGCFLKSLDSLPLRVGNLCRYLLKQWLWACENRDNFAWDLRTRNTILLLPQAVRELVTKAKNDLVQNGLASYASLNHNTSGPSSPTLVTCPEISEWILNGTHWLLEPEYAQAEGVRTVVLDEYLDYMLNGLTLVSAKAHMLDIFYSNNGKIRYQGLRFLSQEYGASIDALWSWLEELKGCGDITQLNPNAMKAVPVGSPQSPEEDIVAYGGPWHSFLNPFEDVRKIEAEVRKNIEKWFETGEETFQHFQLRRAR